MTHLPSRKLNKRLTTLHRRSTLWRRAGSLLASGGGEQSKSHQGIYAADEVIPVREPGCYRGHLVAGLSAIKFYENGIISINLPFPATCLERETVPGTTHPQALAGFARLFHFAALTGAARTDAGRVSLPVADEGGRCACHRGCRR